MAEAQKVSIIFQGKSYVISTSESHEVVVEAAKVLDTMATGIAQTGAVHRDDQRIFFAALQALVAVIKERDSLKTGLADHTQRLTAALDTSNA